MDDAHKFDTIIEQLQEKFTNIGQDTEDHLQGLLHSKPITYWDYIQTDALLNLQIQRTSLAVELVFIAYHQINDLIFKMILWEFQQVAVVEVL
jgi:tryptophan 2,3-dioxygenase